MGQDQALFEKFKQFRNSEEFEGLNRARKKIVENELRDFRLGGAELLPQEKERFLKIQEELSALSSRFNDNLLDGTNSFMLHVENADELSGIPDDVLETARETAAKDDAPGWKFTLHAPSYCPVMQYADNRALREKMYRAYSTRASELSKVEWNNTPLISKILELREEEARMLGFDCYAEVSLATKNGLNPKTGTGFSR